MSKRAQARETTRRQIVEATAKLHGQNGVLGTSWQDIAKEADVALATVYAHFPSLDDLLPACGELVMERVRPPRPESASAVVGDARRLDQRLARIATELFDFYERGGPYIEVDLRERELPGMREWEQYLLDLVAAFVREALRGSEADINTRRVVCALLDFSTFKSLRARRVSPARAAKSASQLAAAAVRDQAKRKQRSPAPATKEKR